MKILGVNIAYDGKETVEVREEYKKNGLPPKELGRIRVYDVTNEYDYFKKYRIAYGRLGIIRVHMRKVIDYWLFRRLRYFISNCNPTRRETSRPLRRKE